MYFLALYSYFFQKNVCCRLDRGQKEGYFVLNRPRMSKPTLSLRPLVEVCNKKLSAFTDDFKYRCISNMRQIWNGQSSESKIWVFLAPSPLE